MRNYKIGDQITVWRNSPDINFNHIHKPGYEGQITEFHLTNPRLKGGWLVLVKDIRPKYWCVKQTDDPRWKRIIDYINSLKTDGRGALNGACKDYYYGFDGNSDVWPINLYSNPNSFKNNPFELTIDEWCAFNYDGLSDVAVSKEEQSSIPENYLIIGNEYIITSGVSIHGVQHGTKCVYLGLSDKPNRYKPIQDIIVNTIDGQYHTVRINDLQKEFKPKTMETVKLTRKQLIQLHQERRWQDCSSCLSVTDGYIKELGLYADDNAEITIREKDLKRIPELNQHQRDVLGKYITIPKTETFSRGEYFKIDGFDSIYHIVRTSDSSKVVMAALHGGNALTNETIVKDFQKITEDEMKVLTANHSFKKINVKVTEV